MENLLPFTLFGSGILCGIILFILLICLLISDKLENGGWAFVLTSIFLGVNHFWGTIPVASLFTWSNVLLYVFIGFVFSLIRTYFKGRELTHESKRYFKLKEHVFRWWFLFPICALNWVFGDLLVDLYDFVYGKIESVYDSLFNAHTKKAE